MILSGAFPLVVVLTAAALHTQRAPDIQHRPLDCVAAGEYPVVKAVIGPGSDIRTAKVYFRSDKYPKFYFVEMALVENAFLCLLPKPSLETQRIIYYIEAVDVAFNNTIGEEHVAEVRGDCAQREPEGPPPPGGEPGIIVGATEAGAPTFPPGFETVGIIGAMTSAGVLSGLGGGSGIGTAVAVGAAAVGTGGLVVATTGGGESTTTQPTATTPFSTTTAVTTTVPETTTTTTVPGTTTTTVVTTTTTTTVPATTTTAAALAACFTASDGDGPAGCKVDFDASCSTGEIVNYEWRFQDNPPATVSGPSRTASYDWTSDPACGTSFTRLVRLTVRASDSRTAQTQTSVNPSSPGLSATLRAPEKPLQTSFASCMNLPPAGGRLEIHMVLNGVQADVFDNSAPHAHRLGGRQGWNTIEAYVTSPSPCPVLWRLDFSGSEHFDPGSIRVEAGVAAWQDSYSVVLWLSGAVGELVKLAFRLQ